MSQMLERTVEDIAIEESLTPLHVMTTETLRAPMSQKITMLTAVILPLVGVFAAAFTAWQFGWMGWPFVAMLIGGWLLTGLGITIGFHRLLSHRAFETYRPIRAFWMALGAMSVEGSPLTWCAVHRRHHAYSDRIGDPHSPHLDEGEGWLSMVRGLIHAQFGWLVTDGHWSKPELERYVPDLLNDPLLKKVDRYYGLWVLASLAIPALLGWAITGTAFGAWLGFLWGGLVRIFVTHHITWSINSICHVFGWRKYESGDRSTNNPICGVLGLGEGWHNNHHAFPNSARHGLAWYEFDLSWIVIRTMKGLGLVWNIKLPTQRLMDAKRLKA